MSAELVVYTTPSYRPGILARPTQSPFRRVVGMEMDQETLWVPQKRRLARIYDYDPSQAKAEALRVPDAFALRARVFFQHWLAASEYMPYNCHSFASLMEGGDHTARNDFSERRHILAGKMMTAAWAETSYPLAMGERGIIASVQSAAGLRRERATAHHSVIGLGEDNPDCLQVTQAQGFMALDNYESVLEYYRAGLVSGSARLYARQTAQPPSPAVG